MLEPEAAVPLAWQPPGIMETFTPTKAMLLNLFGSKAPLTFSLENSNFAYHFTRKLLQETQIKSPLSIRNTLFVVVTRKS
jgi:hypothetical protein